MNLNSRVQELRRKHQALSQQVEVESRSPAADPLQINKLKKQKLALKEEIQRLTH
ncbi:YdcH family protein [Donghicola tyrosinivorans]|jgi:hypothetical protein|uniref:DUF465 domain-containing protein n=1 Tax=Donghicola tyrosinivorans TaxID=1652492 RepID=A0A2T0X010_9RHOB|nr:DUF465 domain-containing protein [Donghicola tyrosinivorans]MEC9196015.1 DUF465 domain-containing protein [Pseudomonadota bacterium]PRY92279.1 hypothetical protein CLV74_102194 [Donghicola tyrosinivorans]